MTVSLKEDALVLVTEDDGGLPVGAATRLGLYYHDTQFLSGFAMRVNGVAPILLSANTEQSYVGTFQLTNAATTLPDGGFLPPQSLSIRRTRFLADGWRERIGILNCNAQPVALRIELEFEATFRDMFAVRASAGGNDPAYWDRYRRPDAGPEVRLEPVDGGIRLARLGRDGVRRTTDLTSRPGPDAIEGRTFIYERTLPPQGVVALELAVVPREDGAGQDPSPAGFDEALDALNARYRRFLRSCAKYTTSSESLDDTLLTRSALDLRALIDFEDTGPYPTAGIPWYAVPFGRDGLICAYQTLGWNPDLARGTLRLLARYQGKTTDAFTAEEPGKIFHELRRGELARLGEIPHRPYYGTVDATPLFALVFAETIKWTADRALWRELLPAAERALTWCDTLGDSDRDGYIEYGTRGGELRNQGWKDSAESLCGPDGHWTSLPAALVEVQAYVYAAKVGLADLYAVDGDAARADALRGQARELREQFERDFWMEDEGCYAQALDGSKRQVPAVTSNAGHALWTRIAGEDRARRVAARLLAPDMFSGWGVRTLSALYPTYNPMSYHNGSVWPHDNAIIAHGFARYGLREEANAIVEGLIEAGKRYPNARLPELFCGFSRDLRFSSRPADYLVSCIPQAWSAGMVFHCLRALLGMEPDLERRRLVLEPALPPWLTRIEVEDLEVHDATVSFAVQRERRAVRVTGGGERVEAKRTTATT
ncbi:MAG TPA: glycogen debranching N-terminal domain-containing protein [Candidatus Limnocylindria bacterium]|nr:glycogen debranching N-terminal domain-containing protein [Candidatus Limnocylindria bacterium]